MPTVQKYLETWEGTLADWDIFTSGPVTVDIVTSSVIVGAQSLRLLAPHSPGVSANILPKTTSSLHYVATKGKLRTLLYGVVEGGGVLISGLSCQQSVRDINPDGTSFYFAGYSHTGDRLGIGKATNGLQQTLGLMPFQVFTPFTLSAGSTISIEFEWEVSGTSVILTLRKGTTTDYSNLAQILTYTDSSSALLTTVGQGLCYATPDFSSNPEFRVDQTTGFEDISRASGQLLSSTRNRLVSVF